jgi:alpha-L-rhamnosidase
VDKPIELTCEYQTDPIAIDVPAPRLAWVNRSSLPGDTQTAYRITVTTETATVWDSGRIESCEHHQLAYSGEPLVESTRYRWTVMVWDGEGNESPPSDPGVFETGIMGTDGWRASWITMKDPTGFDTLTRVVVGDIKSHDEYFDGHYHAIYLHKTFTVPATPARARIHVCGLGYYQLYINGRRVGDRHLDPAQTEYKHGALYSTFDVAPYLVPGENGIGIVLGNGRHVSPFGYGPPMAIAELRASLDDGSEFVLCTDSTWIASHGPIRENGIYLGEVRDEREAIPGWSTSACSAERTGASPAVVLESGPELSAQGLPPVRPVKVLRATGIHSADPGVHVYDFGVNLSAIVRLTVSGPAGQTVRVRFSELLDSDGRLHLGTNREAIASDTYILAGDGTEVYEPAFTYHGFRYAELSGFPGVPTEENLFALVTHTDVQSAGAFRCSLPLFNKIHEAVLRGQVSNLSSVPTDCPQRGERMGWLGDAQLTAEEAMHNFDMAGFYTKYLEDIRHSQAEDGSLSDVTPAYWPLYPADPAWGTAYATLVWFMYFYYGDRDVLARHYEGLKRYVDFMDGEAQDGILRMGKYGDWCPPGCTYPKRTPMALTSTWYYYHDTLTVARIAGILGEDADAGRYQERAESVKAAFNLEFNDGGKYAVTSMSPIDTHGSQTSQLLPLALDMVPPEHREQCIQVLLREVAERFDYHPDTGIVGWRYLLEVLSELGHPDAAYRILNQTSYPSIGYMIDQGATTLWERWENLSGVGMNSHNHIMFGSLDTWFYKTICGISATEPAWTRVRIAPWLPPGMSHAEATLETVQGTLASSWSWSDGRGKLVVRIPVGTTGEVVVPGGEVVQVGSGEHSFEWTS